MRYALPLAQKERASFLEAIAQPGQCWVYPTETFYGLGALATDSAAVSKIYKLKQRPDNQPLLVLVSSLAMLQTYAQVSPKGYGMAQGEMARAAQRCFGSERLGKIAEPRGERFSFSVDLSRRSCPTDRAKRSALGGHQRQPARATGNASLSDMDGVDLYLDGGVCPGGAPSTLVDLRFDQVKILRKGVVATQEGAL